jgi:hypothetical protein
MQHVVGSMQSRICSREHAADKQKFKCHSIFNFFPYQSFDLLFAIRYSLFAIRYSLFAIRYSLFMIHY